MTVQNRPAANILLYRSHRRDSLQVRTFVSETEFSRELSYITGVTKSIKAMTFPSTVRKVQNDTFRNTAIRAAVLNEGLKELGR